MFTLIKNASIYTPDPIGIKDVLIAGGLIAAIGEDLQYLLPCRCEVIDADGRFLFPGLIDQHVHVTGGGGEGGFKTRISEISINDLVENGITTVVGILGTDGVTRSLENLYAKVKALEEQGMTAFMYTGSYQVPVVTLTGSIQRDIVLIDKVLGAGEIAVSDHRSFQPSPEELARIASECRVGGLLAGKPGILHLHMGDGEEGLNPVFSVIEKTPLPITQFVPTHVNRSESLFKQAMGLAQAGGTIDLSAGYERDEVSSKCIPAYEALHRLLENGIDIRKITMSSDGNGSMPVFDKAGKLVRIEAGSCCVLLADIRKAVTEYGIPLQDALKIVTSNPAAVLKLDRYKGRVAEGFDADLVLSDHRLGITDVYARGRRIVAGGKFIRP
jgi:beta-aspartyl-dipeptidase (metallo-type)